MPTCEKCWGDAYKRVLADSSKSQTDHYYDLLKEREENPCTVKEQTGAEREKIRRGE